MSKIRDQSFVDCVLARANRHTSTNCRVRNERRSAFYLEQVAAIRPWLPSLAMRDRALGKPVVAAGLWMLGTSLSPPTDGAQARVDGVHYTPSTGAAHSGDKELQTSDVFRSAPDKVCVLALPVCLGLYR